MNLIEFSEAVKEIVRGTPTKETVEFVKTLPVGLTSKTFGFLLSGKIVKVLSTLRSIPSATKLVLRISPSKDYDYSLRVQADGKTKVISKRFASDVGVDEAQKQILLGQNIERIFYEIITTEDFEITFSEYEGTVIKSNNEDLAIRYFQSLLSLFPFVEAERESKQIKIVCEFDIQPYEVYKKEEKYQGSLACKIEIDGKGVGTKGNNFRF